MDNFNLAEIGKRISERRKLMGLTQEQLAERMDVSIQMISNLERGVKAIRIDNLIRLSQILKISTDYILTGKQTTDDMSTLAEHISQLEEDKRKMIEVLSSCCLLPTRNVNSKRGRYTSITVLSHFVFHSQTRFLPIFSGHRLRGGLQ